MIEKIPATSGDLVATITTLVVALFGVTPQSIVWAAIGGIVGSLFAKPAGPVKTALIYTAATMLSAIGGTYIANKYMGSTPVEINTVAAGIAVVFHLALAWVARALPSILTGAAEKLGIRVSPSEGEPK